jgi:hypothetical protein
LSWPPWRKCPSPARERRFLSEVPEVKRYARINRRGYPAVQCAWYGTLQKDGRQSGEEGALRVSSCRVWVCERADRLLERSPASSIPGLKWPPNLCLNGHNYRRAFRMKRNRIECIELVGQAFGGRGIASVASGTLPPGHPPAGRVPSLFFLCAEFTELEIGFV